MMYSNRRQLLGDHCSSHNQPQFEMLYANDSEKEELLVGYQ